LGIDQVYPVDLVDAATRLADQLRRKNVRIVFAESCTAGLVSAALATVPGISAWLCGSAVTYQDETKAGWLGVAPDELEEFTAVSAEVATSMARGVLKMTPKADLAVSVTGHLGPGSPPDSDGVIFIGTAFQGAQWEASQHTADTADGSSPLITQQLQPPSRQQLNARDRPSRQLEAAIAVLNAAVQRLEKRK
jgi:nicotinamide-nucleotide amidase